MKKKTTVISLIIIVMIVSLGVIIFSLKPPVNVEGQVEDISFDELLTKYVSDVQVDYIEWKKNDFVTFERHIKSLESISLSNLDKNERKAFWINAYNALTIYGVLKRIPGNKLLANVFSVQLVPGFFDKISYAVAGESLTLNEIEDEKLRSDFGDERIHFAIVCASRSCPKIQNSIFIAKGLKRRLNEATRMFIQDETRNRLDREKNILYLSQIFKWYEADFVDDSGSVINYLKRYLTKSDAQYLSNHEVKTEYLYYDWLVNIKQ